MNLYFIRDLNFIGYGNLYFNWNLNGDRDLDLDLNGVRTSYSDLNIIRDGYIHIVCDLALTLNILNNLNRNVLITGNFDVLNLFNRNVNIDSSLNNLFRNNGNVVCNNLFHRYAVRDLDVIRYRYLNIIRNRYRNLLVNVRITVLVDRLTLHLLLLKDRLLLLKDRLLLLKDRLTKLLLKNGLLTAEWLCNPTEGLSNSTVRQGRSRNTHLGWKLQLCAGSKD